MDWYNIDPHNNASVNFSQRLQTSPATVAIGSARKDRLLGGVLKNVPLAWLAENCTLRVVSLQKDEILSSYTFSPNVYNCAGIACVEEIAATNSSNNILLAVCLDSHHNDVSSDANANISVIAIYSVGHNCVLSCFRLPYYVTTMRYMSADNCKRSLMQSFDGCLAVGTQEGQILVIDLYINKLLSIHEVQQTQLITPNMNIEECKIVDYDRPPAEIRQLYQKCLRELREENIFHFALRIEVVDSSCAVESLLPIDLITGLAAGLEDGRLVVYDLIELQIFYVHKRTHNQMPLVRMDFLEPTDDPRACLYILALYDNGTQVMGELHDLMYENRATDSFGCYLENFLRGSKKLTLQLENSISSVIDCQAISKLPSNVDNEDATSLFALSWHSALENLNKLLVFDINQWYKEEMPSQVNLRRANCYLAGFQLKSNQCGMAAIINPVTIAGFDSLQRCEEHFYPNSLSFDCSLLTANGCMLYKWPGVQNKLLNSLREKTATLFLEPEVFFEDIRRVRLLPQFTELHVDAIFSKASMCEALLGVALEHNCIGLLRDCARSWADGSFSGNHGWYAADFELSLVFLVDWIWKRAAAFEARCNEICKGLLNTTESGAASFASYQLDHRSKRELGAITGQLKHLCDLMDTIVKHQRLRRCADDDLVNTSKHESLRMAANFRNLIFWLINIGVLPENMHAIDVDNIDDDNKPTTSKTFKLKETSSIYPYKRISDFYACKRAAYAKIDEKCLKKSGSCRFIFIDAFLEHECMQRSLGEIRSVEGFYTLREYWQEGNGRGLYPPSTIVSMLRIMLLPHISYESKCSILLYFFLDLHVALNDNRSEHIRDLTANLLKFSSVFELPQHLVRNVQGFWHLDHGNCLAAVDEFSSPFNQTQNYDQWLVELQVESLLIQNAAQLAMRILDAHPNLIAPFLKLKILLANNLIAEAFHFARSKDSDVELMQMFFVSCLKMGNLGVVRDLALNEREGQLVEHLLRDSKLPGAENLHFVYLLQKSKYIEAVSYMDELSTRPKCSPRRLNAGGGGGSCIVDGPDLVNTAMNTMPPVTLRSTDVYFSIKNKIKQRETQNRTPMPLSSQLIKQNANKLPGGIYRSSALSAHFASCYFDDYAGAFTTPNDFRDGDDEQYRHAAAIDPLSARNAPFLRKPQTETHSEVVDQLTRQRVCFPKEYKTSHEFKRKHIEYESLQDCNRNRLKQQQEQPRKRLRVDYEEVFFDLKRLQSNTNLTLKDDGFNIIIPDATVSKATTVSPTRRCADETDVNVNAEELDIVPPLKPTTSNGLQGILKLTTPEPTTPRKLLKRGESPAVEEKTLRFTLPQSPPFSANIETPAQFVKHKTVTRTLSKDSLASDDDNDGDREIKGDEANTTQYYSIINTTETLPCKDSGISMTSKPPIASDNHTESSVHYQTARECYNSPSIFGVTPRRPLSVAQSTVLKPESQSVQSTNSLQIINTSSSGLGADNSKAIDLPNSEKVKPTSTATTLKIVSVGTITSSEFAPSICSSKVGENKLSEQTTVHMVTDESVLEQFKRDEDVRERIRNKQAAAQHEGQNQAKAATATELDTTVDMSSTDVTPLEMSTNDNEGNKTEEKFQINQVEAIEVSSGNEDALSSELIQLQAKDATQLQSASLVMSSDGEDSSPEIVELLSSSAEGDSDDEDGGVMFDDGDSSEDTDLDEGEDDETDSENDLPNSALGSTYSDRSENDDADDNEDDSENVENDDVYENDDDERSFNVHNIDTFESESNRSTMQSPQDHMHLVLEEDFNEENAAESVDNITAATEVIGSVNLQLQSEGIVEQSNVEKSEPKTSCAERDIESLSVSPKMAAEQKQSNTENTVVAQPASELEHEIPISKDNLPVEETELAEPSYQNISVHKLIVTDNDEQSSEEKSHDKPTTNQEEILRDEIESSVNSPTVYIGNCEANIQKTEHVELLARVEVPTISNTVDGKEPIIELATKDEIEKSAKETTQISELEKKSSIKDVPNLQPNNPRGEPELATNYNKDENAEEVQSKNLLVIPDLSNTSFNSLQSNQNATHNLHIVEPTESEGTILRSTPINQSRGQSVPPQSELTAAATLAAEHLDSDSRTSMRRKMRGTSVPPQAIDSSTSTKFNDALAMTPATRARYVTRRLVGLANSIPNSPKSNRSSTSGDARSPQVKPLDADYTGATPNMDSPALRLRSLQNTVSKNADGEGSDLTKVPANSNTVEEKEAIIELTTKDEIEKDAKETTQKSVLENKATIADVAILQPIDSGDGGDSKLATNDKEKNAEEAQSTNLLDSTNPSFVSPQSNKNAATNVRTLKPIESGDIHLRSTPINRKRGQSMPPQNGLTEVATTAEEYLEFDSHTSKRCRTRGISVPPQAIDGSTSSKLNEALPTTPTTRVRNVARRRVGLSKRNDSPNSPKSSRSGGSGSGRSSQFKRLNADQTGATPNLDSPALRTRSRLRTVSENTDGDGSDITQASTPSAILRKQRRSSISNRNESDGSGIRKLRVRQILLKDEENDDDPTTSALTTAYVETRRLTRTQHKLLNDQTLIAPRISEDHNLRKKHEARSHSVKSHDDEADDAVSVYSSTGSELRRSSRLRGQTLTASNTSLDIIPEQDDAEGVSTPRAKRTRANRK